MQPLQSVIRIETDELPKVFSLLNTWLEGHASLHPAWRHALFLGLERDKAEPSG